MHEKRVIDTNSSSAANMLRNSLSDESESDRSRVIIEDLFLLNSRHSFSKRYSITSLDFDSTNEFEKDDENNPSNLFGQSLSNMSQITVDSLLCISRGGVNQRSPQIDIDALDLAENKNAKCPARNRNRNSITSNSYQVNIDDDSNVISKANCRSSFCTNYLTTSIDFSCLDDNDDSDYLRPNMNSNRSSFRKNHSRSSFARESSFARDYVMTSIDFSFDDNESNEFMSSIGSTTSWKPNEFMSSSRSTTSWKPKTISPRRGRRNDTLPRNNTRTQLTTAERVKGIMRGSLQRTIKAVVKRGC